MVTMKAELLAASEEHLVDFGQAPKTQKCTM